MLISRDVRTRGSGISFNGHISGNAKLADDLSGTSMYMIKVNPSENGNKLISVGEGSLFAFATHKIPVKIETIISLRLSPLTNTLKQDQVRIVTENGELKGNTYHTML